MVFQRAKSVKRRINSRWFWEVFTKDFIRSINSGYKYPSYFVARINVSSKILDKNSHLSTRRVVTVWAHMLFVNTFCSHWKYYNIMHDIPDLAFKSAFIFSMNPSQQLEQVVKHVHIQLQKHHSDATNIVLLSSFKKPYSCAWVANFEQVITCWEISNHKHNLSK